MSRSTRGPAIAAALALVLAFGTGCGQKSEQTPKREGLETFVGSVEGTPAYVAVITDGERLSGFVSDGKLYAKWFATNELDDGEAQLIARDGAELGEVSIDGEVASGEVLAGLDTKPFSAELASGDAGLFTAAEKQGQSSFEAGWIVLPDGSERGTYDTFLSGAFETNPAPELKPTVHIPGFGPQLPHQLPSLFLDTNLQAP